MAKNKRDWGKRFARNKNKECYVEFEEEVLELDIDEDGKWNLYRHVGHRFHPKTGEPVVMKKAVKKYKMTDSEKKTIEERNLI